MSTQKEKNLKKQKQNIHIKNLKKPYNHPQKI